MTRYIVARLLRTLLTLIGVVTLAFILGRVSGDPVSMMMPIDASEEDIARTRAYLGLDRPLPQQYIIYVSNILRGDFGTSIIRRRPALETVLAHAPASIRLGSAAFLIAIIVGIPAGMMAAYYRNRTPDNVLMTLSLAGQSLPSFFLGIVFILIFSVQLNLTPVFGSDTWRHYLLPVATLSVYSLAIVIRLTRSSMLEVLSQDYVRTARAKGLSENRVRLVHTLRNALIPVVTLLGLQLGGIISGSAIIETVFAWPGMGQLAIDAVNQRDFPIIQTVVLLAAFAFTTVNFGVDLLYLWLDPRIRY
jgi:peptide/nickel transport system permease protein